MERVHAVLADYRERIDALGATVAVGVLTSAVRDAANGAEFTTEVRERHGIAARTIPGELEARLTYRGATSDLHATEPIAVIDIGGGSTEVIVGCGGELRAHVSTQVGVVRHTERHLHDDPPAPAQLAALRADAAATFAAELPAGHGVDRRPGRRRHRHAGGGDARRTGARGCRAGTRCCSALPRCRCSSAAPRPAWTPTARPRSSRASRSCSRSCGRSVFPAPPCPRTTSSGAPRLSTPLFGDGLTSFRRESGRMVDWHIALSPDTSRVGHRVTLP